MSSTGDRTEPAPTSPPPDPTSYDAAGPGRVHRLGSAATGVLAVVVLALVAVVAAEGWYLWLRPGPVVSSNRPVVTGAIASQAAVAAARQDAEAIFSTSWRDYDAHTAQVTTLMTPTFATRYRAQAAGLRSAVLQDRVITQTRVREAGVVTASPEAVTALLFVDSYTTRHGSSGGLATRRALLSLVRNGSGWLVADVTTR
ncbi:MAG: hypothetical protein ACR2K3_14625 [Nocardioides sp.]